MRILGKNIKGSQRFNSFGLMSILCILIFTLPSFISGNLSNLERANKNKPQSSVVHNHTNDIQFQPIKAENTDSFLFSLNLVEESETNDEITEETEEKTVKADFSHKISPTFLESKSTNSFKNFKLSLQKRISIPFFLLHHSLKIPSA